MQAVGPVCAFTRQFARGTITSRLAQVQGEAATAPAPVPPVPQPSIRSTHEQTHSFILHNSFHQNNTKFPISRK